MAVLTVIAVPNGSGKSSIIGDIQFEGRECFLEADAIANRIDPVNSRRAAVAAAREVICRTRIYLTNNQSFAIETTLASGSTLQTMRQAIARGFLVRLVYVCLDDPERCIQRVRERAAQGGHDVPDSDIRRRYHRSLSNLPAALNLVHQAVIYDNSESEPRKMLETRSGNVVWRVWSEPAWVAQAREALLAASP